MRIIGKRSRLARLPRATPPGYARQVSHKRTERRLLCDGRAAIAESEQVRAHPFHERLLEFLDLTDQELDGDKVALGDVAERMLHAAAEVSSAFDLMIMVVEPTATTNPS